MAIRDQGLEDSIPQGPAPREIASALKTKILIVSLLTVLGTFLLAVGWEFWAEEIVLSHEDPAEESAKDHWEYVLTSTTFALLALLPPAMLGLRWARGHQRDLEVIHKQARALEQAADATMITDAGGIIEYVNPAFEGSFQKHQ